jgi:hypothetical protein
MANRSESNTTTNASGIGRSAVCRILYRQSIGRRRASDENENSFFFGATAQD